MEKKEAIREWCIEKAMILTNETPTVKAVIDIAKELEAYISK